MEKTEETMKRRKEKVGSSNGGGNALQIGTKRRSSSQETEAKSCECNKILSSKTKHACILEAHESTRQRLDSSIPKDHEDHIADKGFNSMTHYNAWFASLFSMPQAMKMPDAKAAVDKEWKKLETVPA